MHPNLKLLSYSSLLTLHSCPRKYELNKLLWRQKEESYHFDFGKIVGIGVQTYMITRNKDLAYIAMLVAWPVDLDNEDGIKQKKTFWYALHAIDKFIILANSVFSNYEVAIFEDQPAVELGFTIDCGNGFTDRGFVDVIARHKLIKEFAVIEIKTTGAKSVHEAAYKNSGQALGYDLVLEQVLARLGIVGDVAYKIFYPVYMSYLCEWEVMEFHKTNTSRALWLKHILIDIGHIQQYDDMNYFPMHGESCLNFNKPCKHFGLCEMKTESLVGAGVEMIVDDPSKYQFSFSIDEIITKQLAKFEE